MLWGGPTSEYRFGGRRELSAVLTGLCSHPHPAWGGESQTLVRRPTSGQDSGRGLDQTAPPYPHLQQQSFLTCQGLA